MRELVTYIRATCDMCKETYDVGMSGVPEVEGVTWSFRQDKYELDCCEKCLKEAQHASFDMLRPISREVVGKKRTQTILRGPDKPQQPRWNPFKVENGMYQCPACGLEKPTGRGIAQHHNAIHGKVLLAEDYGLKPVPFAKPHH